MRIFEFLQIDLKWHFERLVGRPHKRVVKISFDVIILNIYIFIKTSTKFRIQAPFFDDPEPLDPPGITPQVSQFLL